ncbi:hypothetical protein OCH7691_02680 [Oceanibacterium hippocampi]|uniref:DUF2177 domain-containing protein n=2 Tax=Oceanibacterium hippocampi TaxID=745714 RepID=A0A1Y5TCZ1_9PROT|nr:hypothetical protein OCH7691_02680 [Oceanibacterium hippocampi]
MQPFVAYGAALAAFLVLDLLWLGIVARRFYVTGLGDMLRPRPRLGVAFLFYLVHVVGIVVFAVLPALETGSAVAVLGRGLLLGLVAYGAYNLTNLATLKGWPWRLSAVDLAWGSCLTGASALAGFHAAAAIGGPA